MPHLLELPEEMILEVTRYLSTDDLTRWVRVCQTLHRIARPVLYKVPDKRAPGRLLATELEYAIYNTSKRKCDLRTFAELVKRSINNIKQSPRVAKAALLRACDKGASEVVRRLLDEGIGPDIDGTDETPLILARREGHDDIVRMLLSAGATLKGYNLAETGMLFLNPPGSGDQVNILGQELIDLGLDIHVVNYLGESLLDQACQRGTLQEIRLLSAHIDVNQHSKPIFSAINRSETRGGSRSEVVHLLLSLGANIDGNPVPLHSAARVCDPDIIQQLLDAGADAARLNILGNENAFSFLCYYFPDPGRMSLERASLDAPAAEIIKLLLAHGLRLDSHVHSTIVFIQRAAQGGAFACLRELLYNHTADILQAPFLPAAFMGAASLGDVQMMRRILQLFEKNGSKIEPDALVNHTTALHVATEQEQLDAVNFLLHKCKVRHVYTKNWDGDTAGRIAFRTGNKALIDLFA
ncbi:ankyrin repeat-containing domain protein [Aspergillus karnatakaensis]|uniref:ankyrin repeat-containing domain protein n=1 Tax=Aspergillus karnatakaensis TaxID=1810916 RepID=UPI003CCE057B